MNQPPAERDEPPAEKKRRKSGGGNKRMRMACVSVSVCVCACAAAGPHSTTGTGKGRPDRKEKRGGRTLSDTPTRYPVVGGMPLNHPSPTLYCNPRPVKGILKYALGPVPSTCSPDGSLKPDLDPEAPPRGRRRVKKGEVFEASSLEED